MVNINIYGDSYAAIHPGNIYEWTQKIPLSSNYATAGSSEYRILKQLKEYYDSKNITIIFHTNKNRLFFPRMSRDYNFATIERHKKLRAFFEEYIFLLYDKEKDIIDHYNYYTIIDKIVKEKTIHFHWSVDYYKFSNGLTFHLDELGIIHNPLNPGNHMDVKNNEKLLNFIVKTIKDKKWIS